MGKLNARKFELEIQNTKTKIGTALAKKLPTHLDPRTAYWQFFRHSRATWLLVSK
jgi:hypothetical protein